MSEKQKTNNEIIDDCEWFADKHRGKNIQSGPHWSTIIRFPKLYDEAVRLEKRVETLEAYIADFCTQSINALDLHREGNVPKTKDIPQMIEDMQSEITRLTAENAELREANRWISVDERLPEWSERVLIRMSNYHTVIASYFSIGNKWINDSGATVLNVTHWMPLPPMPSEGYVSRSDLEDD